jgi:CheY-like chemotaxis protein
MNTNQSANKQALVIEDEPMICRVCRKTLVTEGFEVDIAVNGQIAKEMADKKEYDLYFSDIRTPGMNGIDFYNYLTSKYPQLTDRVIFTTGDILSIDVKKFLQDSTVPFLPKPFTPDELRAIVREVIR